MIFKQVSPGRFVAEEGYTIIQEHRYFEPQYTANYQHALIGVATSLQEAREIAYIHFHRSQAPISTTKLSAELEREAIEKMERDRCACGKRESAAPQKIVSARVTSRSSPSDFVRGQELLEFNCLAECGICELLHPFRMVKAVGRNPLTVSEPPS